MNIKAIPPYYGKPTADGIVIELNSMEAGFLRAALYHYADGSKNSGFASQLWTALDKYHFLDYDKKYSDSWRKLDEEEDD
jgi:hypothetical protein